MAFQKLQIKQLSQSGQLLSVVTCHGGQVSVFRSSTHRELQPYLRALAGIPGAERFAITVDGQEYVPSQHILVGYGEEHIPNDTTVKGRLISLGLSESSVNSLLMSYGLERVADSQPNGLTACQARRISLLVATLSNDKVLVLNDPFEPIAREWRERFAELIVTFARSKKAIIVVPALTYRPEYWIDNELIARIQVGESIQKTIGFGANNDDVNTMVKQLRAEMTATPPAPPAPPNPPAQPQLTVEQQRTLIAKAQGASQQPETFRAAPSVAAFGLLGGHSKVRTSGNQIKNQIQEKLSALPFSKLQFVLAGVIGTVMIAGGIGVAKAIINRPSKTQVAENTPAPSAEAANPVVKAEPVTIQAKVPSEVPPKDPIVAAELPPEPPAMPPVKIAEPPQPVRVAHLLDLYSSDIKQSVIGAFQNVVDNSPDHPVSKNSDSKPRSAPAKQKNVASDILKALQQADEKGPETVSMGGGHDFPPPPPNPFGGNSFDQPPPVQIPPAGADLNQMTVEDRRNLMRQRFREAIERAAQTQ